MDSLAVLRQGGATNDIILNWVPELDSLVPIISLLTVNTYNVVIRAELPHLFPEEAA